MEHEAQRAIGSSQCLFSGAHNYPLDLSIDTGMNSSSSSRPRPRSNLLECFMFSDSDMPPFFHHRAHYHSGTTESPVTVSTTSSSPVVVSEPLNTDESELTPISSTIRREGDLHEDPRNDNPVVITERKKRRNAQARKIREAHKAKKVQLESESRYLEIRNGILRNRVRRLLQEKTAIQNAIVRARLARICPPPSSFLR